MLLIFKVVDQFFFLFSSAPADKKQAHTEGIQQIRWCRCSDNLLATIGHPGCQLKVFSVKQQQVIWILLFQKDILIIELVLDIHPNHFFTIVWFSLGASHKLLTEKGINGYWLIVIIIELLIDF